MHERPAIGLSSQGHLRSTRDRAHTGTGIPQPPTHPASVQQRPQQQSQGTVPNFVNNQDIVHIILTSLYGPSSFEREHVLRIRAMTNICVALLSERKGERLMTEMLERYVVQSEWQHASQRKARFEETLSEIIRRGEQELAGFSDDELNANVLPHTHGHYHHQSLGRMSSVPLMKTAAIDSVTAQNIQHGAGLKETHMPTAAADSRGYPQQELTGRQALVEEFFTEACLQLLDTLKEFSPPCLMELSREIFADLDQNAKPYASLIIIIKFFFYRFMNKCIAYPEVRFLKVV
jgi:hypothetical protein